MNADDIIDKLRTYFQAQAELHDVETAFLYGSWAAGRPREESDVDVAVLFLTGSGREKIFDRITVISLDLTRLLKKEVNVLALDAELSRPMLHYNAIIQGIPVYMRDFSRYVDLKLRALFQAEDFGIFGPTWQSEIVKKRLEALGHA